MERQIHWLEPEEIGEIKRNYQIVRPLKGGRRFNCAILSNRITWVRVHYVRCTQPCTWPNCEQCDMGRVPELKAYMIVVMETTHEKKLLELSGSGAAPLKEWQEQKGLVHGVVIEVGRKNDKDNGGHHCTIKKGDAPLLHYGEAPEVRPILETMWRFSPALKSQADSKKARREGSRGEPQTPAAGPITTEDTGDPKVQKKARKRS